jgi:hypothetical protein
MQIYMKISLNSNLVVNVLLINKRSSSKCFLIVKIVLINRENNTKYWKKKYRKKKWRGKKENNFEL